MEYFCNVINSKVTYKPRVLLVNKQWRKIAEHGHENEIPITFPGSCNWFINKCMHVGESKSMYDLSVLEATDLYNIPKLIQSSLRNTLLQITWKSTVIFTP